jgi:hypothetical protein
MNDTEVSRILRDFNRWRRGEIKEIPEDNHTVGQAIDYAIKRLKFLRDTEKQKK